MSILSDRWIKKMAMEKEMIKPFVPEQKKGNVISYGLSSFGNAAFFDPEIAMVPDNFFPPIISSFSINL